MKSRCAVDESLDAFTSILTDPGIQVSRSFFKARNTFNSMLVRFSEFFLGLPSVVRLWLCRFVLELFRMFESI